MAKQSKKAKTAAKAAPVAKAAPEAPVAAAKLTRRNATPSDAVLAPSGNPVKLKAAHNKDAWAQVEKACPATAAKLAKLLDDGPHGKRVSGGHVFVSYLQRRGYLAQK